MDEAERLEHLALSPIPVDPAGLNPRARIPYGVTAPDVMAAMTEFIEFLGFINTQLASRDIPRFETMLMPANFSSMVGEFMTANLPKHARGIVKNGWHNGHPDLVPVSHYDGDAILHGPAGIEVKASRYPKGWQGHNPEDVWLMVFYFSSGRPTDQVKGIDPAPFRFNAVYGAQLDKDDWQFAGRSATSRRTITAAVKPSGFAKMTANYIYRDPSLKW